MKKKIHFIVYWKKVFNGTRYQNLITLCNPHDLVSETEILQLFNRVIVRISGAYSGERFFMIYVLDQLMSNRIINTLLDLEQLIFC